MVRVIISDGHGGSLPGRPRSDGKRSSIPLKKGRNEIDQLDLDVALAVPQVAALFGSILHLEPVPAVEQPPAPLVAPTSKGKAESHKASAKAYDTGAKR